MGIRQVGQSPADQGNADPAHVAAEGLAALVTGGDEQAFTAIVRSWSPLLQRTAMVLLTDRSRADDLVRRTWLRVVAEIATFHPPPRLRAWVCRLLLEEAGTRRVATPPAGADSRETVPAPRFLPPDHEQWPGHWSAPPAAWPALDDARPRSGVGPVVRRALDELPEQERVVVGLRDVAGCEVSEICEVVRAGETETRELLHRGRARVRQAIEDHVAAVGPDPARS